MKKIIEGKERDIKMSDKEKIKLKINEFINKAVDKADEDDRLDFFNIEINNHNGTLQMDISMRYREKVY